MSAAIIPGDILCGPLPGRAKLALGVMLARRAEDGTVHITGAQLAAATGLGRRCMQRALRELREAGLIRQISRGGHHRAPCSIYRVMTAPSA